MRKLSKDMVKKAIVGSGGIRATIAKRCSVTRQSINDFVAKHPDLMDQVIQEKESILDMGEGMLYKKVKDEDLAAIKYLLTTQAKHRGYGDQVKNEVLISELKESHHFDNV